MLSAYHLQTFILYVTMPVPALQLLPVLEGWMVNIWVHYTNLYTCADGGRYLRC